MSLTHLFIQKLGFEYPGASSPLFDDLQLTCSAGWTGVCGANGSGKSTLLQLIAGNLIPDSGSIVIPGRIVYCEQRTDDPPPQALDFCDAFTREACVLRGRLGIVKEWLERWTTLSHGERKRLQIGAALWEDPDILLVDEPSNHLDLETTELLTQSLKAFSGIGLIVTHDRSLLDQLCYQCLWLQDEGAIVRSGGYTAGKQAEEMEAESAVDMTKKLKSEAERLGKTAAHYRAEASRSRQKVSRSGLAPKDHDTRNKIGLARFTGKDGLDGQRLRQVESRLQQLNRKREGIAVKKEYEMGIWMDFKTSARNQVFFLEPRHLTLGEGRALHLPRLEVRPTDKIILKGPNGSGKSTLIQYIVKNHLLPEEELLYMQQEIGMEQSRDILARVKAVPKAELGKLMRIVRRLGSDPKRLLSSDTPSPGEIRKLLLALGILRQPGFLVIDEPTNHLDLPSIVCLEEALRECPCGYLLVSHDERFLQALGEIDWEISVSRKDVRLSIS
jgi:macrolide transport system ATP-binding/permease protein